MNPIYDPENGAEEIVPYLRFWSVPPSRACSEADRGKWMAFDL